MIKRILIAASLVGGLVMGIGGSPGAHAAIPSCGAGTHGVARLASDPAGDTTYAGQPGLGMSDSQEDLRFVDASVSGGTVSFAIGVEDLTESDPPGSVGLRVSLDLATDDATVAVDARRSYALADPGSASVNGADAADGVTANFNSATTVITVSAPASVLPAAATSFTLTGAETRADGGVVLAPLTDTATGDCAYAFATPVPTAPFDPTAVTVTVIDTGIEASNPEFDYDENVSGPNGQLVGWWDFSGTTSHPPCGDPTTTWCATRAPYDPDLTSGSHGTGTSGMAAGTNASGVKTPSACPGCNLAVAKIKNEDSNSNDGSLAAAIRWAVDVVDTDVISVSLGSAVPIPEPLLHDTYVAQRYARDRGVFVTFSNGNGWGNAGVPGQPGGFKNYGNSVDVLSVGANGLDGFLVTTDPEVTGPFTVMTSASAAADDDGTEDGYHSISGTSFAAPFTAGLAAHLIASGRLCGAPDVSPAFVEQLVKDTAIDDPTIPPSHEGYGEVSLSTLRTALGVLCSGDARPPVDPLTKKYVDRISGTERKVSSRTVSGWTLGGPSITRIDASQKNAPGIIGLSTPTLADTEIYELTLLPGQSLSNTFSYLGDVSLSPDFDVYLYDVTGGVNYNGHTLLQASAKGAGEAEQLSYRNTLLRAQRVRVVVVGFSIISRQAFSVTGTPLGAPVDEGLAAVRLSLF